ncbi:MAG: ribosome biogenesis GTPase Der [Gammaproteobacteria bacterium]|nr:ribosome biogenesis GTPase Der [Gammaproteobacteria bacterium]
MKPVIALVGRPNVGKSTLFNKLTRTKDAIVANFPGLTRDRQYGSGNYDDLHFTVIDTGGIGEEELDVEEFMSNQSWLAVEEADIIFFMVDARAGLTPTDSEIAKRLRTRVNKKVYVVVNKIDGVDEHVAVNEFYSLGFDLKAVAAAQNRGVRILIEETLAAIVAAAGEPLTEEEEVDGVKIAFIGRPNVGKSTLVNRILGEERVVVFDMPGTTRDSIYIPFERFDKQYVLIDTAGIRRRGKIKETVEKFSVIKAIQAIDDSHVTIMVIDAQETLVDQDLHLLGYALDSGRGVVIAVNKWDGLTDDKKNAVKKELDRRLGFVDYVDIHFISALHGTGVGHIYKSIDVAYESATSSHSASRLTQILEGAVAGHNPPLVNGRRVKLRYAHMGGVNPPYIVIHGNQTKSVPESYRRYLSSTFRKVLKLRGTPVRVDFKTGDNPFSDGMNELTSRQQAKKRRLQENLEHQRKQTKKKRR